MKTAFGFSSISNDNYLNHDYFKLFEMTKDYKNIALYCGSFLGFSIKSMDYLCFEPGQRFIKWQPGVEYFMRIFLEKFIKSNLNRSRLEKNEKMIYIPHFLFNRISFIIDQNCGYGHYRNFDLFNKRKVPIYKLFSDTSYLHDKDGSEFLITEKTMNFLMEQSTEEEIKSYVPKFPSFCKLSKLKDDIIDNLNSIDNDIDCLLLYGINPNDPIIKIIIEKFREKRISIICLSDRNDSSYDKYLKHILKIEIKDIIYTNLFNFNLYNNDMIRSPYYETKQEFEDEIFDFKNEDDIKKIDLYFDDENFSKVSNMWYDSIMDQKRREKFDNEMIYMGYDFFLKSKVYQIMRSKRILFMLINDENKITEHENFKNLDGLDIKRYSQCCINQFGSFEKSIFQRTGSQEEYEIFISRMKKVVSECQ